MCIGTPFVLGGKALLPGLSKRNVSILQHQKEIIFTFGVFFGTPATLGSRLTGIKRRLGLILRGVCDTVDLPRFTLRQATWPAGSSGHAGAVS